MAELVDSSNSFFMNCEQYNATSENIPALIKIEDRSDILTRQDRYMVHVTRFALDTQASLFYLAPDTTATISVTLFAYLGANNHRVDKKKIFVSERTFVLTEGAATLADFLEQLNEAVPTMPTTANRRDPVPTIAGQTESVLSRAGQWTITSSGRFEFQASKVTAGRVREPRDYDTQSREYFVNLVISESMRKILGVNNATLRVFGRESTLKTYRRLLTRIQELLPSYRNNISNWRWEGTAEEYAKSGWYTDMYRILSYSILQQLMFITQVANGVNTQLPMTATNIVGAINYTLRAGITQNAQAVTRRTPWWEQADYFVENFRRAADGVHRQHEHSKFTFLHNLANNGNRDTATFRYQATHQPAETDHTGDFSVNQNVFVPAFKMNAKQAWGTWSRGYILNIPNPRQVHINKNTVLTDIVGGTDQPNLQSGGLTFAPFVGDTIYIPASTEIAGSGAVVRGSFQRGVIQSVEVSTVVRATDKAADDTYLITFDTELNLSHVHRRANLSPIENPGNPDHGIPNARVAYGTRRVPYNPMVYNARVHLEAQADGGEIIFNTHEEFPVFVGDHVYIGHEHGSSTYAHEVHAVNYTTGAVTIEAGPIATIANGTAIIGMSQFYSLCHTHDALSHQITASIPFINQTRGAGADRKPLIHHEMVTVAVEDIVDNLENAPSIDWVINSLATQGLRTLIEAEMGAPAASEIDPTNGSVVLKPTVDGIIRGVHTNTHNAMVCTDIVRWMGADTHFDVGHPNHHMESNQSLFPSNFFQMEIPNADGPYADTQLRSFLTGHIDEDWMVEIETPRADLVLTAEHPALNNQGGFTNNINGNSAAVLRAVQNQEAYRLCSQINLPTRVQGEPSGATAPKYIVYTHHRSNCPGYWRQAVNHGGVGTYPLMSQQWQFDYAIGGAIDVAAGNNTVAATFMKINLISGYKEMDAVQIVYKENNTLAITNPSGINFSLRTQDSIRSTLSGQCDLAFKWKSLSVTSNDLLASPERTGDANALQPILSSYSLPTNFDASVKATGAVSGFDSTPYGTITFSELGPRRYHSLIAIPGGLRRFNLTCVLDPKDDSEPKEPVQIPPGGRFSCQLLFVSKK